MKALQAGIVIGVAFLLPLLANMSVRFIAEPPEYASSYVEVQPKTRQERDKLNAEYRQRDEQYRRGQSEFNLFQFYVTFPLGILELIVAYFLRQHATVGAGLFFGGLATVAFTSYCGWETLPGLLRYTTLVFTLLLLLGMALGLDRWRAREAQAQ